MKTTRAQLAVPLLAILAAWSSSKPFTLDSTVSTYPFVTRLFGTLDQRGDSLIIDVNSGLVRSQIPQDVGDDGTAEDVSIAFGLGSPDSDSWSFDHATVAQRVTSSLRPGATSKFGALRFVITGLDTVPVVDRWLVAQVLVQQHLPGVQAGLLASYACSEENLRGDTPSSAERTRRMRANYSHTC